jgi:hypothetical protein
MAGVKQVNEHPEQISEKIRRRYISEHLFISRPFPFLIPYSLNDFLSLVKMTEVYSLIARLFCPVGVQEKEPLYRKL